MIEIAQHPLTGKKGLVLGIANEHSIGPGDVAKCCAGTDQQIAVFARRQQTLGGGGSQCACGERRHADQSGREKPAAPSSPWTRLTQLAKNWCYLHGTLKPPHPRT